MYTFDAVLITIATKVHMEKQTCKTSQEISLKGDEWGGTALLDIKKWWNAKILNSTKVYGIVSNDLGNIDDLDLV